MKFKNILWIILMIIFITLAYLLFDRGFNVKTKVIVNYEENSDVIYKVYLKDNDIYNKDYLNMNEKYISKLVDKIDIDFKYNSLFDKDINGYYEYRVDAKIITYKDDINDIIWTKDYQILNNKVNVLDKNNFRNISIDDKVSIDYNLYKDELFKYNKSYGIDLYGYLEVSFIIDEHINFKEISNEVLDNRNIKVIIPLSYDMFRIDVNNDNNKIGNYSDFSKRENINYLLLIMGSISLSLGISFFALIVRDIIISSKKRNVYSGELRKILRDNSSILVKVKKFYNKKKYNLIYLDSFQELLDVYKKVKNPISYREVKKGHEVIFLMTNDDDAWIYRLVNDKK